MCEEIKYDHRLLSDWNLSYYHSYEQRPNHMKKENFTQGHVTSNGQKSSNGPNVHGVAIIKRKGDAHHPK